MNAADIALIRSSFDRVMHIEEAAAELFYHRLFELDATLRPLFQSDLKRQGRLLMKMIATAVDHLDDLGTLVPVIQRLGQRHRVYGVKPAHYETVGAALLWTLEQGLGEHYTTDVERAWSRAYAILSGVMLDAAGYGEDHSFDTETAAVGA